MAAKGTDFAGIRQENTHVFRRTMMYTTLCGLLVSLSYLPAAAQPSQPALQLVEVRSALVPDSGSVTGVAATATGAVVSYAGRSWFTLVSHDRPAREVRSLRLRAPI